MTFTSEQPAYSNIFAAVPQAVEAIGGLSIDDQLGLLWFIYEKIARLVNPIAPDASMGIKIAGGLAWEVANLTEEEQLQFMRDLLSGVDNRLTRAYGVLSSNNKLAFWYQLAEWMRSGEVIVIPENYRLSVTTTAIVNQVVALGFNQQIAVLRLILGKMGINPF